MSTRCLIGYKTKEGIKSFYCHHDGYVEYPGVGYTLTTYYNDENKARDLIELCYLNGTSAIKKTLEDTKKELYEDKPPLPIFKTKKEYIEKSNLDIENNFLYDSDGKWKVYKYGKWKPIPTIVVINNNNSKSKH